MHEALRRTSGSSHVLCCRLVQGAVERNPNRRECPEIESIDACFRACRHADGCALRRINYASAACHATRLTQRLGMADRYQLSNAGSSCRARARHRMYMAALYTPDGASIHPGRLVRGLARAVEAHVAAVIYEQTAVTAIPCSSEQRTPGHPRGRRNSTRAKRSCLPVRLISRACRSLHRARAAGLFANLH